MRLRIDPRSKVPASEQVADRIRELIEAGSLRPGDRLPPIRDLAPELGLAPNTVAKAYRALEAGGLLVGRGRHGTFVADPRAARRRSASDRLSTAADAFADRAVRLGAGEEVALAEIRRAIRERRARRAR